MRDSNVPALDCIGDIYITGHSITSYQIGRRCLFSCVSGSTLTVGSWLINAELTSPYHIYRLRHISLIYCTCIYNPDDVPKRQSVCRRLTSYPSCIKSCLVYLISVEVGFPQLLSLVGLWTRVSIREGLIFYMLPDPLSLL